jgi:PhzF family phenazine biosynthesis protein
MAAQTPRPSAERPPTAEVLRYAAFTVGGAGGNPAGVVLDAGSLDEPQMRSIARAIGYSETAFVMPAPGSGRRPVRYFSPRAEVAFCGHATIATAVAIAERDGPGDLLLATAAGPVSVCTRDTDDGLAATLLSPPASTRPAEPAAVDEALAALGWGVGELDPACPVHVASAGNDHLVLGLAERATLAALDYDYERLAQLMQREGWTTVHLFWRERPRLFHVRNAFPPGGVVEDPATGAAAAAFGGYLRALGLVDPPVRLTLLQGHDMGSPSRLWVDLVVGEPAVRVTGTARRIALTPYAAPERP